MAALQFAIGAFVGGMVGATVGEVVGALVYWQYGPKPPVLQAQVYRFVAEFWLHTPLTHSSVQISRLCAARLSIAAAFTLTAAVTFAATTGIHKGLGCDGAREGDGCGELCHDSTEDIGQAGRHEIEQIDLALYRRERRTHGTWLAGAGADVGVELVHVVMWGV